MCGIVGIFDYQGSGGGVSLEELQTMRDFMASRGPDSAAECLLDEGRAAFGHRRLSIIDLSDRAVQPMASSDGKLVVTFNGEIYNYQRLRQELEAKGRVFRTSSDTEVLLHLYAEYGANMVSMLRGMFAFALWDSKRRGMLLARDPYGIKPLYYADDGRVYRFASQARALIASGRVSSERNVAAEVAFLLWGSVPEPLTIFRSVKQLPSGTMQWVDSAGISEPRIYASIAKVWTRAAAEPAQAPLAAILEPAVRDSVQHHLVSDVPVGVFLSAGVDSGALLGLMAETPGYRGKALTLRFREFAGQSEDEGPLAAEVARQYGIEHHVRSVDEQEFTRDLPAILNAMDQPTVDGVNSWFISKAAAEHGLKVAVSGLGGDELLGGYPSFVEVPRLVRAGRRLPGGAQIGKALRMVTAPLVASLPAAHPKMAGLLEYCANYPRAWFLKRGLFMPWELGELMGTEEAQAGLEMLDLPARLEQLLRPEPGHPFAKIAVLEATQYMRNQLLRDTDWASMAHSIEVRVPLVDYALLSTAAPAIAGYGKSCKTVLAGMPKRALPDPVVSRVKTGFGTPVPLWLQRAAELDSWKRIPSLRKEGTHWSRRWAFAVLDVWGRA